MRARKRNPFRGQGFDKRQARRLRRWVARISAGPCECDRGHAA